MKTLKSLKPTAPVPRVMTDRDYVDGFFNYVFHQIETNRTFIEKSLWDMTEANTSGQAIRNRLEGSITVFERATHRAVQEEVVAFAWKRDGNVTRDDLRKFIIDRVLGYGSGGTRSTSATSNLVQMMTAEAWCRVLNDLGVEK